MLGWRWLFRRDRADERPATPFEARDEQLSAYLDDALTPAERAEVDAALAGDADLRVQLDGLRTVRTALRSLDEVRAPRSFALTAPPAPGPAAARRFGMPRLELATRVATIAAAALFVVALVVPGGGSSETVTRGPGVANFSAAAPVQTGTVGALESAPAPLLAAPASETPSAGSVSGTPSAAAAAGTPPAGAASAAPAAATPAGRALAAPQAATPAKDAGLAAPAETPSPAGAAAQPSLAAPAVPTVLAPPPGVAEPGSPGSPEGGTHRLITVGLGALTVLLAALSAGEWIVRRGRVG
jgi:hypothetical protein